MRLVNIDDCNRALFYKQSGGKDSLITVESAFNILEALPTAYDIGKVIKELDNLRITGNSLKFDLIPYNEAIEIVKQGGTGTETETIRDKAVKWNNNSTKRVPYEFIDYVEGKREASRSRAEIKENESD